VSLLHTAWGSTSILLVCKKYKLVMCLNEMEKHDVSITMMVLYCMTKRISLPASPIVLKQNFITGTLKL
jgi:hypothetical protein